MKCADYNVPPCFACGGKEAIEINNGCSITLGIYGKCFLDWTQDHFDTLQSQEDMKREIEYYHTNADGHMSPYMQKIIEVYHPEYLPLLNAVMLLK